MHFCIVHRARGSLAFQLVLEDGGVAVTGASQTDVDACVQGIREVVMALREGGGAVELVKAGQHRVGIAGELGASLAESATFKTAAEAEKLLAGIRQWLAGSPNIRIIFPPEQRAANPTQTDLAVAIRYDLEEPSRSGRAGLELIRRGRDNLYTAHFNDASGTAVLFLRGFTGKHPRDEQARALVQAMADVRRYRRSDGEGRVFFVVTARNGRELARSRWFASWAECELVIAMLMVAAPRALAALDAPQTQPRAAVGYLTDRPSNGTMGFESFRGDDRRHYFHVNGPTGAALLFSHGYSSPRERDAGMRAVVRVAMGRESYQLRVDRAPFHFVILAANSRELARSRDFETAEDAQTAVRWLLGTITRLAKQAGVRRPPTLLIEMTPEEAAAATMSTAAALAGKTEEASEAADGLEIDITVTDEAGAEEVPASAEAASAEAGAEAVSAAGSEASAEPVGEAGSEAGAEAVGEAGSEAGAEVASDAGSAAVASEETVGAASGAVGSEASAAVVPAASAASANDAVSEAPTNSAGRSTTIPRRAHALLAELRGGAPTEPHGEGATAIAEAKAPVLEPAIGDAANAGASTTAVDAGARDESAVVTGEVATNAASAAETDETSAIETGDVFAAVVATGAASTGEASTAGEASTVASSAVSTGEASTAASERVGSSVVLTVATVATAGDAAVASAMKVESSTSEASRTEAQVATKVDPDRSATAPVSESKAPPRTEMFAPRRAEPMSALAAAVLASTTGSPTRPRRPGSGPWAHDEPVGGASGEPAKQRPNEPPRDGTSSLSEPAQPIPTEARTSTGDPLQGQAAATAETGKQLASQAVQATGTGESAVVTPTATPEGAKSKLGESVQAATVAGSTAAAAKPEVAHGDSVQSATVAGSTSAAATPEVAHGESVQAATVAGSTSAAAKAEVAHGDSVQPTVAAGSTSAAAKPEVAKSQPGDGVQSIVAGSTSATKPEVAQPGDGVQSTVAGSTSAATKPEVAQPGDGVQSTVAGSTSATKPEVAQPGDVAAAKPEVAKTQPGEWVQSTPVAGSPSAAAKPEVAKSQIGAAARPEVAKSQSGAAVSPATAKPELAKSAAPSIAAKPELAKPPVTSIAAKPELARPPVTSAVATSRPGGAAVAPSGPVKSAVPEPRKQRPSELLLAAPPEPRKSRPSESMSAAAAREPSKPVQAAPGLPVKPRTVLPPLPPPPTLTPKPAPVQADEGFVDLSESLGLQPLRPRPSAPVPEARPVESIPVPVVREPQAPSPAVIMKVAPEPETALASAPALVPSVLPPVPEGPRTKNATAPFAVIHDAVPRPSDARASGSLTATGSHAAVKPRKSIITTPPADLYARMVDDLAAEVDPPGSSDSESGTPAQAPPVPAPIPVVRRATAPHSVVSAEPPSPRAPPIRLNGPPPPPPTDAPVRPPLPVPEPESGHLFLWLGLIALVLVALGVGRCALQTSGGAGDAKGRTSQDTRPSLELHSPADEASKSTVPRDPDAQPVASATPLVCPGKPAADASLGVLVSPFHPAAGESVRVLAATLADEAAIDLQILGADHKPVAITTAARTGVPSSAVATATLPAGEYTAVVGRAGTGVRCQPFTVAKSGRPAKPALTGGAWAIERAWSPAEEALYSAWVQALFAAPDDQDLSFAHLDRATADPRRNLLHDALRWGEDSDPGVRMRPDSADLPYALRGYWAWKRGLPFAFRSCSRGEGGAPRCTPLRSNLAAVVDAPPSSLGRIQKYFQRTLAYGVHTGNARTAHGDEDSDFYPVALSRRGLRPGTIYADPYGPILVLVDMLPANDERDGLLLAVDAQPDGTITRKQFWGGTFLWSADAELGGTGFKRFRPVVAHGDSAVQLGDAAVAASPAHSDLWTGYAELSADDFYRHVEAIVTPGPRDPLRVQAQLVDALARSVRARVDAVERGAGHVREGGAVIAMPRGFEVFETVGPWESLASPGRDLRLLVAIDVVKAFAGRVAADPKGYAIAEGERGDSLAKRLTRERERLLADPRHEFSYKRSDGSPWRLSLAALVERTAALEVAYNPNDCPEARWGAPQGSDEARTCARRAPGEQQARMDSYRVWFHDRAPPRRGTTG